jgi:hypothetical protein
MTAMPIFSKNLKKSSCQKPLVSFQNNFTGIFFEGPFLKIVQRIMISRKTWPPGCVEL